jgi:hypothetical protein
MSGYPDDGNYRDDPDRAARERNGNNPDRDARAVAAARAATAVPGTFLILNGLFGLVCVAVLFVPMVLQPDMLIKAARDMIAQQPQGKDRQDAEQKLDDKEKELQQNRVATQVQNGIELGVLALGNLVAILGGFAMRGLGSYGMSITGAVASIIPALTGCCCTGILFGIWSVVVLMRPEVKAGFAARRRASYSPDSY